MRNLIKLVAVIATVGSAACDNPYDPNGPAIDPNAPRVHITTPARGTIAGDVKTVTVTGTVTDDSGIDKVLVNDTVATVASDGTFTAQVPVHAGTNLLHAIATDKQGNTGKESRAVVAGPQATLARQIPNAITATVSAQAIDAVARGAATFIQDGNLTAAVAPMNPVVNVGAPDGPDCLYGQAHIKSLDVATADIVMAPQDGGIFMSAELNNVKVGMHLQWAVACADGSRDITISASKISVQGMLNVGVAGRNFDIRLNNQNVGITGFDLDLGGVPGTIVDMLHLDTAMGPILGFATERFVVPMLNKSLAGLNEVKTVELFGKQVDVDVKPQSITFNREGGMVLLNATMRAKGDSGNFVYVTNTTPVMDMSQGFQLAVADDTANQLMTSLWSAKGLDTTLDLKTGMYGTVGQLYDSVQLEAMVPPFVDAGGERLVMTVGDMLASFKLQGSVTTAVAINAEVGLEVIHDASGALRFDVGDPTVYVDILDESVEGSNPLSNSEFEEIVSFALSRIVAVGSGSVGAVPLPAFGGVAVTSLSIEEQTGYLVVAGEIQ
jgi:hypothetical protein